MAKFIVNPKKKADAGSLLPTKTNNHYQHINLLYTDSMNVNYSDISDLVKQASHSPFFSYGHPEHAEQHRPEESGDKEVVEIEEVVEHEPDDEVKKYVEPRKEAVDVDEDLKKAGVQAQKTTSFPSYQKVQLPVSDETIIKGLSQPISTSARWLAELCMYLLRQAHLTLKKTHGKIVRVIRR